MDATDFGSSIFVLKIRKHVLPGKHDHENKATEPFSPTHTLIFIFIIFIAFLYRSDKSTSLIFWRLPKGVAAIAHPRRATWRRKIKPGCSFLVCSDRCSENERAKLIWPFARRLRFEFSRLTIHSLPCLDKGLSHALPSTDGQIVATFANSLNYGRNVLNRPKAMIPYAACMCFGAEREAGKRRRQWKLLTAQVSF
ncbi:hypothetical protein CDAR_283641 [Caerostris darwini]|uniref:Uncharacterized protein n=1 Tax=Caerostris darwini TaxID=1538125 RepID=A0AAV4TVK3_9ARAC|nr:hypothetical protein CDAR_283641 [Caerostris darwini]